MPKKTIREVMEITGVTEKALRYYDEKGILHPSEKSSQGRKEWLYEDMDLDRIKDLVLYKTMGISLEQIHSILNDTETDMKDVLEEHIKVLRLERDMLNRQIELTELLMIIEKMSNREVYKDELRKQIAEINDERK